MSNPVAQLVNESTPELIGQLVPYILSPSVTSSPDIQIAILVLAIILNILQAALHIKLGTFKCGSSAGTQEEGETTTVANAVEELPAAAEAATAAAVAVTSAVASSSSATKSTVKQ
jgi:hypothetical protein